MAQASTNASPFLIVFAGNADGLGETRKKELVKSGMHLGLRDEDDVFVVDNPYVFHHDHAHGTLEMTSIG